MRKFNKRTFSQLKSMLSGPGWISICTVHSLHNNVQLLPYILLMYVKKKVNTTAKEVSKRFMGNRSLQVEKVVNLLQLLLFLHGWSISAVLNCCLHYFSFLEGQQVVYKWSNKLSSIYKQLNINKGLFLAWNCVSSKLNEQTCLFFLSPPPCEQPFNWM